MASQVHWLLTENLCLEAGAWIGDQSSGHLIHLVHGALRLGVPRQLDHPLRLLALYSSHR